MFQIGPNAQFSPPAPTTYRVGHAIRHSRFALYRRLLAARGSPFAPRAATRATPTGPGCSVPHRHGYSRNGLPRGTYLRWMSMEPSVPVAPGVLSTFVTLSGRLVMGFLWWVPFCG